ncbi:GAF domain-containing protein [Bacillus sp. AGMB 02131]|uniref:GAF domain-containing protein n=1 Tax=Peribacillus faecalis TaxID=2772559 RepID=A0A927HEH3_9BACI|nr:GAF domain-containing protein [Peribacillus faecalis]MBD3110483.1 GAF domain-containing protein [Peribacillus faecalis]
MFQSISYNGSMEENYSLLNKQLSALLAGENHLIANLSNASALLNVFLKQINWVGFYLFEDGGLVLGPFQGLPACIRIPIGKGVCGTAAQAAKTLVVDDVDQFPGHIACDAASKSEIVIPVFKNRSLIAVLDIDSPIKNRFSKEEAKHLEQFVKVLEENL